MAEQPTMDEMRALLAGITPGSKVRYAGTPGSGPEGKTCKTCAHKVYTGNVKHYPKCGLTNFTHGDATTIKTSTPACYRYHEDREGLSWDQRRGRAPIDSGLSAHQTREGDT